VGGPLGSTQFVAELSVRIIHNTDMLPKFFDTDSMKLVTPDRPSRWIYVQS
jgi:hypothetical protein